MSFSVYFILFSDYFPVEVIENHIQQMFIRNTAAALERVIEWVSVVSE